VIGWVGGWAIFFDKHLFLSVNLAILRIYIYIYRPLLRRGSLPLGEARVQHVAAHRRLPVRVVQVCACVCTRVCVRARVRVFVKRECCVCVCVRVRVCALSLCARAQVLLKVALEFRCQKKSESRSHAVPEKECAL
jgi:hypothetical protein